VLGVPASPGAVGWTLLAAGLAVAAVAAYAVRRRLPRDAPALAASLCLLLTTGAAPYLVWRIVEDLRYTVALGAYNRSVAGPVQAYLQPYLLDRVPSLIPRGATYAAAAGPGVPYPTARQAFPDLALQVLFPRRSVADPRRADYVVAWGVRPRSLAPLSSLWLARGRSGRYPPLYVGKVAR
jgi:hypothetical protein